MEVKLNNLQENNDSISNFEKNYRENLYSEKEKKKKLSKYLDIIKNCSTDKIQKKLLFFKQKLENKNNTSLSNKNSNQNSTGKFF